MSCETGDANSQASEGIAMAMANQPPVLFFLSLTLQEDLREQEEATVEAIGSLNGSVSGILFGLPSFQQEPDAVNNILFVRAAAECRMAGIDLYLGHDLWSRWGPAAEVQRRSDVFNSAYYAAYLAWLAAEARAIGAKGTFAYCEPHGNSPFQEWFKRTGFSRLDRWRVKGAIDRALRVAPPTTLAYPAGGRLPSHFGWTMRHLGKQFLNHKTYKLRQPHPEDLWMMPPRGEQREVHWWGSWLVPAVDAIIGVGQLSVQEFRGLDYHDIRNKYPECQGLWVYAGREERAQVMREMGNG